MKLHSFVLAIESNVQYVEQGNRHINFLRLSHTLFGSPAGHTDEVKLDFFLTTPFASGTELIHTFAIR